jgi:hypothetical protein
MPAEEIDRLETLASGWLLKKLTTKSRWIDAQLRKRYAVPFPEASPPDAVTDWLARIVTKLAYLRLGVSPTDPQFELIAKDSDTAEAEVAAASDAEVGKWELPLRQDTNTDGISKGEPLAYSEASPYAGFDIQGDRGREEDSRRSGSGD